MAMNFGEIKGFKLFVL